MRALWLAIGPWFGAAVFGICGVKHYRVRLSRIQVMLLPETLSDW